MNDFKNAYFISAIDTDIGKTIATGLLAKFLQETQSVITMKVAQTGSENISDDIKAHRAIMGIDLYPDDINQTTCPYVFGYPASPHFSASLEHTEIDLNTVNHSLKTLCKKYDKVLLEGVGGLMVPVTDKILLIDYIKQLSIPIILITSGKLGSINHTLLSLSVIKQYGLKLHGVLYNHYPKADCPINLDSKQYIKNYLTTHFSGSLWGEIKPILNTTESNSSQNLPFIQKNTLDLTQKPLWFRATNR